MTSTSPVETRHFRVLGMDCADDAAEIEHAVRKVAGVEEVRVSVATQMMTVRSGANPPELARVVSTLGYTVDHETEGGASPEAAQLAPGYRRALWTVALLNAGYGVVEMFGGFLSDSQALKADALDFFGDGVITLLGLIAIGWGLAWRARSALLQGIFLGVLGLGVLANTVVRWQSGYEPEAGLMGTFGLIALAVNVAAALMLIPHRTGDANVRAVWLFSRNDAIGNVAVVAAAGLVALTSSQWPDLIVALIIAALFLHSSWSILTDARRDLRDATMPA